MNKMLHEIIYTFGASLTNLDSNGYKSDYFYVRRLIERVAILYMEVQFPSVAVRDRVTLLDKVLACFKVDNAEEIQAAAPGTGIVPAYSVNGYGLNTTWYLGPNSPKFLFYVARMVRAIAKQYLRLHEPERAREACAVAVVYIQACSKLINQHKEATENQISRVLPVVLLDRTNVPEKYGYDSCSLVELEFGLSVSQVERMRRKIEAESMAMSKTEEGTK